MYYAKLLPVSAIINHMYILCTCNVCVIFSLFCLITGREREREGGRERGREGGRKGGTEGERERERAGRREGQREGQRERERERETRPVKVVEALEPSTHELEQRRLL